MRLLIIAPDFAPSSNVGAKRPTGVAMELQHRGMSPVVMTIATDCIQWSDTSYIESIGEIDTRRFPCRSVWLHSLNWRDKQGWLLRGIAKARRLIANATRMACPIDDYFPWAIATGFVARKIAIDSKIDLIWMTVPPFSSYYLILNLWKRTGIPFVVDFRDVSEPQRGTKKSSRFLALQERVLDAASGLTYVAPDQTAGVC